MTVKKYLVEIFLDHTNKDGYPEVYVVKKPKKLLAGDTLQFRVYFVKTKNTPEPLISKKPLVFEVGPGTYSTNVPFLKVEL